jgi:pyruvate dehydrogenase E1 component beta subunit
MKVVCPATPADAKGLIKSSIRDNDPVCFMENTILYNLKDEVPDEEDFIIPLGKAKVVIEGKDISIIAHGKAVHTAIEVAEELSEAHNISAEVLDLRSIRPLDQEAIIASVKKTNRALLVEENKPFCGVDAQICFLIQDQAFDYLDAPIARVSAVDAPQAYSKSLEDVQLPGKEKVLKAALNIL